MSKFELQEAIKHHKEARKCVSKFLKENEGNITHAVRAILGNHYYFTTKLIEELQMIPVEVRR